MALVKLLIVFALIVVILKFKLPLYAAMGAAIVSTIVLYQLPFVGSLETLLHATIAKDTIEVVVVLYIITYLQRMLERRSLLVRAQRSLSGIFNNRRINASLAPILIGLLPSGAAANLCGDIVDEATQDYYTPQQKSFVTSFFRHIPESFLPTYTTIILGCEWAGISMSSFILSMIPMVAAMYFLGWLFYLRKLPRETGENMEGGRLHYVLELFKSLWSLFLIILLILVLDMNIVVALAIGITLALIVYRFSWKEIREMVPSAFEPNMLLNTYLAMLFKYILTATGVLEALPGYFAVLPIPTWLTFALLVFFASLVGGGTAILAISIPLAFSTIPGAGVPLLMLILSYEYAAMQVSPTHVCLSIVCDHFKISLGELIKESIPVVACFCVIAAGYYMVLTLFV